MTVAAAQGRANEARRLHSSSLSLALSWRSTLVNVEAVSNDMARKDGRTAHQTHEVHIDFVRGFRRTLVDRAWF